MLALFVGWVDRVDGWYSVICWGCRVFGCMISIVVAAIVVLFVAIALAMMVRFVGNERIKCPHCGLEFSMDLLLLQGYALVACPFCQQWVWVRRPVGEVASSRRNKQPHP